MAHLKTEMTRKAVRELNEKMDRLRAEDRFKGMYKTSAAFDRSKVMELLFALPLTRTSTGFFCNGKDLREKVGELHIPYNTFEIEPGLVFKFHYCESELTVLCETEEDVKKVLDGCWQTYEIIA